MPDELLKVSAAPGFWPALAERARHGARRLQDALDQVLGRTPTEATALVRTRRDQVLARRLSRVFERDLEMTALQGVQFYVRSGVVTLYGTVAHTLDRTLIVDLVRSVAGVEGVVAHLQIIGQEESDGLEGG